MQDVDEGYIYQKQKSGQRIKHYQEVLKNTEYNPMKNEILKKAAEKVKKKVTLNNAGKGVRKFGGHIFDGLKNARTETNDYIDVKTKAIDKKFGISENVPGMKTLQHGAKVVNKYIDVRATALQKRGLDAIQILLTPDKKQPPVGAFCGNKQYILKNKLFYSKEQISIINHISKHKCENMRNDTVVQVFKNRLHSELKKEIVTNGTSREYFNSLNLRNKFSNVFSEVFESYGDKLNNTTPLNLINEPPCYEYRSELTADGNEYSYRPYPCTEDIAYEDGAVINASSQQNNDFDNQISHDAEIDEDIKIEMQKDNIERIQIQEQIVQTQEEVQKLKTTFIKEYLAPIAENITEIAKVADIITEQLFDRMAEYGVDKIRDNIVSKILPIPMIGIPLEAADRIVNIYDRSQDKCLEDVRKNDPTAEIVKAPTGSPTSQAILMAEEGYTVFRSTGGFYYRIKEGSQPKSPTDVIFFRAKNGKVDRIRPGDNNVYKKASEFQLEVLQEEALDFLGEYSLDKLLGIKS